MSVSIVVPSYNHVRFLCECLQRFLKQDSADLEIVICDGGSTGQSKKILESTPGIMAWCSTSDRRQAHAINKSLRQPPGGILGFLNSDDLLLQGSRVHVIDCFTSDPRVDFVYGNVWIVDEVAAAFDRVPGTEPSGFAVRMVLTEVSGCADGIFAVRDD